MEVVLISGSVDISPETGVWEVVGGASVCWAGELLEQVVGVAAASGLVASPSGTELRREETRERDLEKYRLKKNVNVFCLFVFSALGIAFNLYGETPPVPCSGDRVPPVDPSAGGGGDSREDVGGGGTTTRHESRRFLASNSSASSVICPMA